MSDADLVSRIHNILWTSEKSNFKFIIGDNKISLFIKLSLNKALEYDSIGLSRSISLSF